MSKQPAFSWIIIRLACVIVIGLLGFSPASAQVKTPPRLPAENPPFIESPVSPVNALAQKLIPVSGAPTTEWVLHKTTDNLHPDGQEQQMVWLMNRARSNPHTEGVWLATSTDPAVAGDRDAFEVNIPLLQSQFDSYTVMPPAAFDRRLYLAAKAHSDDLIARDAQDHDGQRDLIATYGFTIHTYRGNVFSYATGGLNAHAGFNIDESFDSPTGMEDPPGHRYAIMAIDRDYPNVGLAAVYENNPGTGVGPYVTTGNYCKAWTGTGYPDHFNQFIVGTVWWDMDGDAIYDLGEGKGGVTVTPNTGTYYAVTGNSGGYAIPVTGTAASYTTVSFAGGGINGTKSVTIASVSVLLDYIYTPAFSDFVYLPVVRK
jgi:hypothetical protein